MSLLIPVHAPVKNQGMDHMHKSTLQSKPDVGKHLLPKHIVVLFDSHNRITRTKTPVDFSRFEDIHDD